MTGQAFRFIHASDFHLEQPVHGLSEIPDHLREPLLDAPYTAALRVFDAAVRDRVDFVILSGDLVDSDLAGPRGVGFLMEQFERLDSEGIAIYWAGGKCDPPQSWPSAAHLPENVHVFPALRPEDMTHFRGSTPVARLVGRSWQGGMLQPSDFSGENGKLFTIAVSYGPTDDQRLSQREGIDFWALGGEHDRRTVGSLKRMIHYPGTPQGRCPEEDGPHGCTLVHVRADGTARAEFLPMDAIRWLSESITLEESQSRADLKRLLIERAKKLASDASERPVMVQWIVRGGETLGVSVERQEICAELLTQLREDFGRGRNIVWSLGLDVNFEDSIPAEWYAEDSMRGDFLRTLGEQIQAEATPLDLTSLLPDRQKLAGMGHVADWIEPENRRRVLREAAVLGAQLLGSEEKASS